MCLLVINTCGRKEEEGGRIGQRVKLKGTGGRTKPLLTRADRTHQSCTQGSVAMPLHPCHVQSFTVAKNVVKNVVKKNVVM